MRNVLIVAILALFLVGCSSTPKVKSINVVTTPIEKLKLNIDTPTPVILQDVNWVIVTEDNISAVWESLKKNNKGVALFALKDGDYGKLATNLAEIRTKMGEYIIILKQYKKYYEDK